MRQHPRKISRIKRKILFAILLQFLLAGFLVGHAVGTYFGMHEAGNKPLIIIWEEA